MEKAKEDGLLEVIEIGSSVARELIMTQHYAHRMPMIQRAFGLLENGNLVGCVTFGQPANPYIKESMMGKNWNGEIMELNRLVIITKTKNSASRLIGGALRRLPKNIPLVSYADCGVGHIGYVYQATNWKYSGKTKERTDMASKDGKHSRHSLKDPNNRVDRSAKHRYWICRDIRLSNLCLWDSLPYPKGETTRHNINKDFSWD